jgi:hypothetical protein
MANQETGRGRPLVALVPSAAFALLQVLTHHKGRRCAFADCGGQLLGAAGPGIARGEHSRDIGFHGGACLDEPPLVSVDYAVDEIGVGVEADENEYATRSQLFEFTGFQVLDDYRFKVTIALELLNGGL